MARASDAQAQAVIEWMSWGREALDRAKREDKLILLDSGATWCHWCHVMDRLTYEDEGVASLVNEKFVPVRIDRDRYSEFDAHLQRAQAVIESQAGGWPLTVILTPEGDVLYKATFVPPRADEGLGVSIGMIELLARLDEYWRAHRDAIAKSGMELRQRHLEGELRAISRTGPCSPELVGQIIEGIKVQADRSHGGFGYAPKFFHASAIEALLSAAWRGDRSAKEILVQTLDAIARGGVFDQVGGGFHRYSTDQRWHVPHFEKLASDNAAMLANYANAYALTGREDFARVARQTMQWIDATLSAFGQDQGRDAPGTHGQDAHATRGFFASQDADVGLDDDGDYFTWTRSEFRTAAGGEAELAVYYFDVDENGSMPDRPGRNVLHVPKTLSQVTRLLDRPELDVAKAIEQVRKSLLAARQFKPTPEVDRTIFTDVNGMIIDAYLTAGERLGEPTAVSRAIDGLNDVLADLRDERGIFGHWKQRGKLRHVGMLSGQAWMMRALVHGFAATGRDEFLAAATTLADYVLAELIAEDGAFVNVPRSLRDDALSPPAMRAWEDNPTRSASSVAAESLLWLARLTGQEKYTLAGRRSIESFAGAVRPEWALALGGYALAADTLLHGPRTLAVIGPPQDPQTKTLLRAGRQAYVPGGLCFYVDPVAADRSPMLTALGLLHGAGAAARPAVHICEGGRCLEPARTTEELAERLKQLRK